MRAVFFILNYLQSSSRMEKVTAVISFGGVENTFSSESAKKFDFNTVKSLEVTTRHDEGPLKGILTQLESVQLQTNHHLTQLVQELKPFSDEGKSFVQNNTKPLKFFKKEPALKRQKTK